MNSIFTAPQAARASGLPYRTLDYYCRTGLLRPSVHESRGIGDDRLFNFADVLALRLIHLMRTASVSRKQMETLVRMVRTNPKTKMLLVIDVTGSGGYWASRGMTIGTLAHFACYVIDIALTAEELQRRMKIEGIS